MNGRLGNLTLSLGLTCYHMLVTGSSDELLTFIEILVWFGFPFTSVTLFPFFTTCCGFWLVPPFPPSPPFLFPPLGSKVCGYVPQGLTTLPCTVANNFLVFHFYFFCFCFSPFPFFAFYCFVFLSLFLCPVPNILRLTLGQT